MTRDHCLGRMKRYSMALSKPQQMICENTSRFRVAVTGRRFGKTYCAIRELCKAAAAQDRECLYVAPSYRMAKGIAWEQIKDKLKQLRWLEQSNEAELTLRLRSGSKIYLKGCEAKDALRGKGYDFICLDEYQDMDPTVWTEVLRPTLSDRKGKALFIGTPRGIGSFSYEMYSMAQSTADWSSFKYTTAQGGIVTEEEIEQAKRDLDIKTFEQEYYATFNTYSGMVYYNFDREHTVQQLTVDVPQEIHAGMDFNIDPFSVAIGIIKGDTLYIFDEINMKGSNTDDVCDEIKRRYPTAKINIYPDPAGRNRNTASAGRSDLTILRNAGFNVYVRHTHTAVRDRINAVNSKLKNAKSQRTCFVSPKCTQVIKSLERMTYKEETNVVHKDGNEHMADAVGYLIDYIWPVRQEINIPQPTRWAFGGHNNTRMT